MSVILIRLDKIGDLISTLPVDRLCPEPSSWVIADGLGWIAEQAVPPRKYLSLSLKKENRRDSFRKLVSFLRQQKPRAVVVFYAPWWVSLACWWAKVPLRITRLSQWHSFLFFNKGLRQSRTLALQHEADYNRELLEFALNLPPSETPILEIKTNADPELLQKYQLTAQKYYVVHPGMFGSAWNWPQNRYNELIESLVQKFPVAITGTSGDEKFLDQIKSRWQNHDQVRILQEQLTMPQLLSLLAEAKAVVAPSTGVLHLAAALGTPAVGIYSPLRVHHPKRWGPRSIGKVQTVLPPGPEVLDLQPLSKNGSDVENNMEKLETKTVLGALMQVQR